MSEAPRRLASRTARAIVALFVLSFVLSGAAYYFSVRAVHSAVASRVSVTQLCETVNTSRARQVRLWTHLLSLSTAPAHETPAQRQAREDAVNGLLRYVRQIFAPRKC